ncbi:MAG TPA: folylpolyglutamate synthase/dihydrofolate synthase family protein [Acidobacteriota bacterium]|jgi:dihydrofolate synthase/folylpolyglutamate synthase
MNPLEAYAYLKQLGNEVLHMQLTLEPAARVLQELGNPHYSFRTLLIGGTNGKGSVSSFAASMLRQAGYRTGLYTSPHLESVLERINIDGAAISPEDFAFSLSQVVDAQDKLAHAETLPRNLTYFEAMTTAAFHAFQRQSVDIAILEVGLGGRLDATNLSQPLVCCITTVGRDHCDILGSAIPDIAREKAGIARPARPLWLGLMSDEAEQAIRRSAPESLILRLADTHWASRDTGSGRHRVQMRCGHENIEFQLRLFGEHQAANAALAVRLVESLAAAGLKIPKAAIAPALEATEIPGRLEKVLSHPIFFIDGGHNQPAMEAVARFIRDKFPEKVHLVFAMMKDKEIAACAGILAPLCREVFLTPVQNARSASAAQLKQYFPNNSCTVTRNSEEATTLGLAAAGEHGTLLACGSLYLVGEIKTLLRR